MLVKFLKPHPKFSYSEGDNADVAAEEVQEMIKTGHVILFPGVQENESDQPKPKKIHQR